MLKVRVQGTKSDIAWFCKLLKGIREVEVIELSEVYANKGTNRFYRMYAEIQENMEEK